MSYSTIIEWLLEEDNPSVRYRTLTELLDENENSSAAIEAREGIKDSEAVKKIFSKFDDEGYWTYYDKRRDRIFGKGTEYFDYLTTHFNLAFLSELGMTREDERIEPAVSRFLNLQKEDGDFLGHYSCLYAYNLRSFIRMGFGEDKRVKRTINLLLDSGKFDGGYLCDIHEGKYKTRETKSCIRGSLKVMLAFAELPEYQRTETCKSLVDYFLIRHGIFENSDLKKPVLGELTSTIFPFLWKSSLTEVLYGLSRIGYGNAEELAEAWMILDSKKDGNGKYILNWSPPKSYFKPGKRGEPNKWITLYALLALKYKENAKPVS